MVSSTPYRVLPKRVTLARCYCKCILHLRREPAQTHTHIYMYIQHTQSEKQVQHGKIAHGRYTDKQARICMCVSVNDDRAGRRMRAPVGDLKSQSGPWHTRKLMQEHVYISTYIHIYNVPVRFNFCGGHSKLIYGRILHRQNFQREDNHFATLMCLYYIYIYMYVLHLCMCDNLLNAVKDRVQQHIKRLDQRNCRYKISHIVFFCNLYAEVSPFQFSRGTFIYATISYIYIFSPRSVYDARRF